MCLVRDVMLAFPEQELVLDERSLAHVTLLERVHMELGATVLHLRLDPVEYLHLCYDAAQCGFLNTERTNEHKAWEKLICTCILAAAPACPAGLHI